MYGINVDHTVLGTLPVYDSREERYLRYLHVAQANLTFETFELKNVIYKSV